MDLDVLLSYLYDNAPGLLQEGSRAAIKQAVPGVAGGLDYFAEKSGEAFAPMSFEDDEEDKARKAKIAEMFGARDAAAAAAPDPVKQQSDLDKLLAAGQRASGQREFMQGTEPLVEDYEKGIAIGGDPSRGSKDEIIARIRAQAAKMAGRDGPSAGGGGLTTAQMTPEIEQRLRDQDQFIANQDIRDARWEGDLARQRQDQPGAQGASEKLLGLQQQQILNKRQQSIDSIMQSVADGAGKVPFEQAQQLLVQGVNLPYQVIGKSPEEVIGSIDGLIANGRNKMAEFASSLYMSEVDSLQASFERDAMMKLQNIRKLVESKQMTPDEAEKWIQDELGRNAQEVAMLLDKMIPQQQAQPVIAGE